MEQIIINIIYVVASILFIVGIKMLGSATTARRGNLISAVGMLLAVVATLRDQGILSYEWIIAGLAVGSIIGVIWAVKQPMTAMPELVALFNGFGGLASMLVGWAEFHRVSLHGWAEYNGAHAVPAAFTVVAISATLFIGAVAFTGSLVAWAKLAGRMSGKPILFRHQHLLNAALFGLVGIATVIWAFLSGNIALGYVLLVTLMVVSLLLGVLGVIPIGGGDMPAVISLLNSFSGLAGCAAGFVVLNNVLIVAGCLVGASGFILTVIMCKAMNRALGDVLFSGFGATEQAADAAALGEMKAMSVEDAYYVLEAANDVVIIPGYGMAVAQAQHAAKELGALLEKNGAQVRFAIHPVAGRMPGHMNVLLAEADVPYEQLVEMAAINPSMPNVDVALVIGANDVVNPAAVEDKSSPIYGMPIINAHEARTVFVLKRGQGAGFSGLVNTLFFRQNCRMIYGDAKATLTALASQFEKA